MRPVNLAPDRLKQRGSHDSTGQAPYIFIGALSLVVVLLLGYVLINNQITSKKSEIDSLNKELQTAQSEAKNLTSFTKFATVKQQRTAGLTEITNARFPWPDTLIGVAKALPEDAWLVSVRGAVSEDAETGEQGGNSATASEGGGEIAVPGPTVELVGCTYRQSQVAVMMSRLRSIKGVSQVLLQSSKEKNDKQQSGSSGALNVSSAEDCRTGPGVHKFVVILTFKPGGATLLRETIATSLSEEEAGGAPSSSSSSQGQDTPAQSQSTAQGGQ